MTDTEANGTPSRLRKRSLGLFILVWGPVAIAFAVVGVVLTYPNPVGLLLFPAGAAAVAWGTLEVNRDRVKGAWAV